MRDLKLLVTCRLVQGLLEDLMESSMYTEFLADTLSGGRKESWIEAGCGPTEKTNLSIFHPDNISWLDIEMAQNKLGIVHLRLAKLTWYSRVEPML
jgi:hypothetical protein